MNWSKSIQLRVLFGLLGVLSLSVFLNFAHKESVIVQPHVPGNPSASSSIQKDEIPAVRLLRRRHPALVKIKRNIFEFASDQSLQQNQTEIGRNTVEANPLELPDVHYLGLYEEKGGSEVKLAAISNGGNIYVGGVGDNLGGKYKVLEVQDEFLILQVLSTNRIVRVPLGRKDVLRELEDYQGNSNEE